jgi:hypothetical protein
MEEALPMIPSEMEEKVSLLSKVVRPACAASRHPAVRVVLTALAIAGGPTYRASRNTVEIQRLGEASMHEYPISASVPILSGDVIKVPERYF